MITSLQSDAKRPRRSGVCIAAQVCYHHVMRYLLESFLRDDNTPQHEGCGNAEGYFNTQWSTKCVQVVKHWSGSLSQVPNSHLGLASFMNRLI